MKIDYEIIQREEWVDQAAADIFNAMLRKQGKVNKEPVDKAARCKLICLVRVDGAVVAIGGIKEKTPSDFLNQKSGLPSLADDFDWELGYFYTEEKYCKRGIASNIADLLVAAYGDANLMASTEITANPGMVKILERLGFRLFGKPWKSSRHDNHLGLFLRFK